MPGGVSSSRTSCRVGRRRRRRAHDRHGLAGGVVSDTSLSAGSRCASYAKLRCRNSSPRISARRARRPVFDFGIDRAEQPVRCNGRALEQVIDPRRDGCTTMFMYMKNAANVPTVILPAVRGCRRNRGRRSNRVRQASASMRPHRADLPANRRRLRTIDSFRQPLISSSGWPPDRADAGQVFLRVLEVDRLSRTSRDDSPICCDAYRIEKRAATAGGPTQSTTATDTS